MNTDDCDNFELSHETISLSAINVVSLRLNFTIWLFYCIENSDKQPKIWTLIENFDREDPVSLWGEVVKLR